jgi:hypothetical protein
MHFFRKEPHLRYGKRVVMSAPEESVGLNNASATLCAKKGNQDGEVGRITNCKQDLGKSQVQCTTATRLV